MPAASIQRACLPNSGAASRKRNRRLTAPGISQTSTLDSITFALLFTLERQRRGSAFRKEHRRLRKINDQQLPTI